MIAPNSEIQSTLIASNPVTPLDGSHSTSSANKTSTVAALTLPTSSTTSKPGSGNSNSLPGHQSSRSNLVNPRLLDQKALNISDNVDSFFFQLNI